MTQDVWDLFMLLCQGSIITCFCCINIVISFRVAFFFKSFRDPIEAIKRTRKLTDVITEQQEIEDIGL